MLSLPAAVAVCAAVPPGVVALAAFVAAAAAPAVAALFSALAASAVHLLFFFCWPDPRSVPQQARRRPLPAGPSGSRRAQAHATRLAKVSSRLCGAYVAVVALVIGVVVSVVS